MEKSAFEDLFKRDRETGETIFHELAECGALRVLVLYRIHERTSGAFVNLIQIKNYRGELCTHVAARCHSGIRAINLIEILVLMGADVNERESCGGETVLHTTVFKRDYELAEWLCKHPQINLDARNYGRLTAFQI
ncbi:NF-kappa-B inhibitor cactus-like [Diprion similis]|uniref:NF-kappa-B inhibitor cactus-like n=1 Tax=Diprion similis TaxID=362088 RepID=UPI001EF8AB70|nr:NF-kappa-B inhibitor cactus-like [Diprion similis]